MKQIVFLFLVLLFLTACGNNNTEPTATERIPASEAEIVTEEQTSPYRYLDKVRLVNGLVIASPYFFSDCQSDGDTAVFSHAGITAEIRLCLTDKAGFPDTAFQDKVQELISQYSTESEFTIRETESEDQERLIVLSYVKERMSTHVWNRYPCTVMLKAEPQPDGNYLLIQIRLDNENSTEETEGFLAEILDAHGISY